MLQKRPIIRGDCKGGPRPCPWVSCRYHLGIKEIRPRKIRKSVSRGYKYYYRQPDVLIFHDLIEDDNIENLQYTCALDIADEGPISCTLMARLTTINCGHLVSVITPRAIKKIMEVDRDLGEIMESGLRAISRKNQNQPAQPLLRNVTRGVWNENRNKNQG
jgi:hypothetical protein